MAIATAVATATDLAAIALDIIHRVFIKSKQFYVTFRAGESVGVEM